jgi:hypothetical protein
MPFSLQKVHHYLFCYRFERQLAQYGLKDTHAVEQGSEYNYIFFADSMELKRTRGTIISAVGILPCFQTF